jgi:hypothetical protein
MAFYTGVVGTPTALKTAIEVQAVANGWTLSGDWLSKGNSHISLTVPAAPNDVKQLNITGACSSDGMTKPAEFSRCIHIETNFWPVTYDLHIHNTPNMLVCILQYDTVRTQVIIFGDLVKVHDSAYVGGNFFFATRMTEYATNDEPCLVSITRSALITGQGYYYNTGSNIIPFSAGAGGNESKKANNGIHAEIDNNDWDTTISAPNVRVTYTDTTLEALFRSPNTWNSQTHLIPMNLQHSMLDGFYGYLGYVEHMRLIRVDNYNIGNVVSIPPDNWKVYPWTMKSMLQRNGGNNPENGHSGSLGFAVRYIP